MNSMAKRILIIAHGHPDVHKGGAEFSAYHLYREYQALGHDVLFLARSEEAPHGGAAFSTRNNANEVLFHTRQSSDFLFSNLNSRYMWTEFPELIKEFAPDVVHFHHYFLLGIEALLLVKRHLPEAKIVFTLHEYLAICHRDGQMLKTNNNQLCYKATPRDCHNCFPKFSPADFFMRERYIKRAFSVVDQFISPSHFLKSRYVAWGLDEDQIEVVENGIPVKPVSQYTPLQGNTDVINFTYIGQINPYKGLDVLLDAVSLLSKKNKKRILLNIHGSSLNTQPKAFKKKVRNALEKLQGTVFYHGPYEPYQLDSILSNADWVVMPSIWWENSPLVIQEAYQQQVPVIASDIGGMAEKVQHGKTGYLFSVSQPSSLASVMSHVIENPDLRATLSQNISSPLTIQQSAKELLALYEKQDN